MSQLAESVSQPRLGGGGAEHSLRRLKTARFYENGWQEPNESRGSRSVLRGTGGEIPPVYPTCRFRRTPIFLIFTDSSKGVCLAICLQYRRFWEA